MPCCPWAVAGGCWFGAASCAPPHLSIMADHRSGVAAEQLAESYLARLGLEIVERNYRCRFGEIDLIALDGDALVFVEVRLRRNSRFGGAAASIDYAKQRKLVAT